MKRYIRSSIEPTKRITLDSDPEFLEAVSFNKKRAISHILNSVSVASTLRRPQSGQVVVSDGNGNYEVWSYDIILDLNNKDREKRHATRFYVQDRYNYPKYTEYPLTYWGKYMTSWKSDLKVFLDREVGKSFE